MDPHEFTRILREEQRGAIEAWSQSRARSAYIGKQTAICQLLGRLKCFVNTRDVGITPHLLFDGFWEMWVTQAIARYVKPGMRCADVGANMGYYTLLLSELTGDKGYVQSWEPQSDLAALIQCSIDVNGFAGRAEIVEAAAGARSEKKNLRFVSTRTLNATLRETASFDARETAALQVATVSVRRLDEQFVAPLDFMKVDAEGWEPEVWEGMTGLFDKSPNLTVCMEFSPHRYTNAAEFLQRMRADGFRVQLLDTDGWLQPVADHVLLANENMVWVTRA